MTEVATAIALEDLPAAEPEVVHGGGRRLFIEAADVFGVELDAQEADDWRTLMMLGYVIDELVDADKDNLMPHIQSILSGGSIKYGPPTLAPRFRNYMARQNDEHQQVIMSRLGEINSFVDAQAGATTVDELVDVRAREAELFADMLCLSEVERPDGSSRHRFNDWLHGLSLSGFLVDSWRDLESDYQDGSSGVEPTMPTRLSLARITLRETLKAARKTPPKLIGKTALVAVMGQIRRPNLSDPTTVL